MAILRQKFTDVTPDKWYYGEIQRGAFYGLLEGTSQTTYEPDKTVTRAEMGAAVTRTFERLMFFSMLVNGVVLTAILTSKDWKKG